MALHLLSSQEVATSCRQRIEACELWLRRLVHDCFHSAFGADYVNTSHHSGQAIFNAHARRHVASRTQATPGRYPRPVDALQLDQLAAVICKHDVYSAFFRQAFATGFPGGAQHLRLVLTRLVPVRNALAHANPISIHDAERALCYSSDLIQALTDHYRTTGMSNEFNAPSFTRIADSMGNVHHPVSTNDQVDFSSRALRPGDVLRIEAEVDATFPPSEYRINWQVATPPSSPEVGAHLQIVLEPMHVAEHFIVSITVTSTKPWHRHSTCDAKCIVVYKVLPPP